MEEEFSGFVGIDFGTSYSSVGVFIIDKIEIIPDKEGNKKIPSVVSFTDFEGILVGENAKNLNPKNTLPRELVRKLNMVLSCPVNFMDSQRQGLISAGYIAGFNNVRLINESTAASIAGGPNETKFIEEDSKILFINIGGGNFDISILFISNFRCRF